jgi:hypothetical protein
MKALISIFIIAVFVFCGWKIFSYYQKVEAENQTKQKVETGAELRPDDLPGLPAGLFTSLQAAQKNGSTGLREWLKFYGAQVQDPRKAWIELDCSLALLRTDPNDAKRIFNAVKDRTSTNSPVYPRIRQLEKSFQ